MDFVLSHTRSTIWASANWANNATGGRDITICKNGNGVAFAGTQMAGQANPAPAATMNAWQTAGVAAVLAVNDYVELTVYQESGGNLSPGLKFGMTKIG